MDIYIKKAVLEIIDRESTGMILSQKNLELTPGTVNFFTKKIKSLHSPKVKVGKLTEESEFKKGLLVGKEDFLKASELMMTAWYEKYQESEEAPSCDVGIVLYEEDTTPFMAFLKMNYQKAFTHFLNSDQGQLSNELLLHQTLLGSASQKPDEGLVVNLTTWEYQLLEKKYNFSGEKRLYFSTDILKDLPEESLENNVKRIKKVAEKIGEKYSAPQFEIIGEVKEAVLSTVADYGELNPEKIGEKIFSNNIEAKTTFVKEIKEAGFSDKTQLIPEAKEVSVKKYGKQKLKLSNGIELIVPMDIYKNQELIEFINQPDGTISVLLKNISDISGQM